MNRSKTLLEMGIVFLPIILIVATARNFVGENPLKLQLFIWVAYILMLSLVYLFLHRQGTDWSHIGVGFGLPGFRRGLTLLLQAVVVFLFAMIAFGMGAVLMAKLVGVPEPADFESYNYLKGNPGLLLLSLSGVYIVSSFGEEVLFRGYLMTRTAELLGDSRLGWLISVVVSTAVFALIHYDWGITGIVQTGFMGFALACSYIILKRKLWTNVLAHALLDTLLLVQLYMA